MRGQKPLFAVVLFMIVSFSVFYIVFQAQFSVLQDRIDTLEKQQNIHVTSPNTDEHAHSHAASNQGHDPEAEEEKDYHQGSPKDNTFEDTHNHTMPTITESKNDDEARIKKYQYDVSILDYESVKSEATLNWVDIKWQHPNAQLARLGEREKGYFLDENFMVDYLEKERAKHASLEDMFPYLVVSFTTIPTRIHGIQGVIQSLHQQLLPPDLIVLNLPKVARRFPNMTYDIPDWALKHPKIKINWIDKDLGAGTKLIPTLVLKDVPPNARIMTVDDDAGPGGHMLLQLYLYSLVYPDYGLTFGGWNVTCFLPRDKLGSHTKSRSTESELAAISPSLSTTVQSDNPALRMCPHQNNAPGSHEYYVWVRPAWDYACTEMRFRYGWYHCGGFVDSNTGARVDVMAGYMGVMYQPRFFVPASKTKSAEEMRTAENMPVFNVDAAPNGWAYKIDDVWLSGWLSANNVPKLVINPQKSVIDGVLTRLPWLKEYVDKKQKIWYDNVVVPIQEMWKDWTPPARADGKNVFEIDSLHSLEGFDQQNALLAKWFISEGIWGNEPDRGQILDDWEWEARYRKESGFTRDWMYDPSGNDRD